MNDMHVMAITQSMRIDFLLERKNDRIRAHDGAGRGERSDLWWLPDGDHHERLGGQPVFGIEVLNISDGLRQCCLDNTHHVYLAASVCAKGRAGV